MRESLCRKGCCTVKWCPLEPSWATTIHKFQGFEAGFEDKDMFRHLIVDPGDIRWEQTCPGALYVALSRARTMGTFLSDTSFPRDSAIYWHGPGISTNRILEGDMKHAKRKGDPKVKCLLVTKRERWVDFLDSKKAETQTRLFTKSDKEAMMMARHSQSDVREFIANIITKPSRSWATRKKTTRYAIPRNYFGQYA